MADCSALRSGCNGIIGVLNEPIDPADPTNPVAEWVEGSAGHQGVAESVPATKYSSATAC